MSENTYSVLIRSLVCVVFPVRSINAFCLLAYYCCCWLLFAIFWRVSWIFALYVTRMLFYVEKPNRSYQQKYSNPKRRKNEEVFLFRENSCDRIRHMNTPLKNDSFTCVSLCASEMRLCVCVWGRYNMRVRRSGENFHKNSKLLVVVWATQQNSMKSHQVVLYDLYLLAKLLRLTHSYTFDKILALKIKWHCLSAMLLLCFAWV